MFLIDGVYGWMKTTQDHEEKEADYCLKLPQNVSVRIEWLCWQCVMQAISSPTLFIFFKMLARVLTTCLLFGPRSPTCKVGAQRNNYWCSFCCTIRLTFLKHNGSMWSNSTPHFWLHVIVYAVRYVQRGANETRRNESLQFIYMRHCRSLRRETLLERSCTW